MRCLVPLAESEWRFGPGDDARLEIMTDMTRFIEGMPKAELHDPLRIPGNCGIDNRAEPVPCIQRIRG